MIPAPIRAASFWVALLTIAPAWAREEPPFPTVEPAAAGIDPAALDALRKRAEETKSDTVLILRDGKVFADWAFHGAVGPIETMSATKSVVNLAVGRLVEQGKIRSLDQPVSDFYPEWKQGRKKRITIRHLMNHTSGLQAEPMTTEIYASPDHVQLALAAELSDDPGAKFFYNNKAVNLLAGIVQRASGQRMDRFVESEVFRPLGIDPAPWALDRAGNPQGMAGLALRSGDLARLGQMMLDEGAWRGKPIVSRDWVKTSTAPGQALDPLCGLLWWRVPETMDAVLTDEQANALAEMGLTSASAPRVEAMKTEPIPRREFGPALLDLLRSDPGTKDKADEHLARFRTKGPGPKLVPGRFVGFSAEGYLGQFLVVIPEHRLVAVRQRRRPLFYRDDGSIDSFVDFPRLVYALVRR